MEDRGSLLRQDAEGQAPAVRLLKKVFYRCFSLLFAGFILLLCSITYADGNMIKALSVKDGDIRNILTLISTQTGVNIIADATVQGKVSVDLHEVTLEEGLRSLLFLNGFNYKKMDNVYMVSRNPIFGPAEVELINGRIFCRAEDSDLSDLLRRIGSAAGINVVPTAQITGKTCFKIKDVSLEEALTAICSAHGLFYRQDNGLVIVDKDIPNPGRAQQRIYRRSGPPKEKLTLEETNINLTDLLQIVSEQSGKDIVVFGNVQDRLANIKLTEVTIDEALKKILSGSRFVYKREGDVYLVGDPSPNSPSAAMFIRTEIFRISYYKAEDIRKILPKSLIAANIDINRDQNSIIFTGTDDQIEDLRQFIAKVDTPVPQISIDVLIVEVNRNLVRDLGVDLNFENGQLAVDGKGGIMNYDSSGSLSKRLLAKVVALIEEGKAEVKANPRLTVLNGYEALINVGKQLNYKITTEQGSAGSTYITTRIQTINAGTTLKIVPWVGASGDITVDIHPEVSNVSGITADGLPEVSQRRVDTSIRVKDGQSISIGGLISSEELHNQTKIPLLGDLPLVGSLFSNKTKTTRDSELVIFITPHLLDMGEIE
ncbi:MAG: secretin and TonB N-terminal domain-containing protein [bacterium]|nr:secretin and TonB N-terminal domain-containing protein [bacterium]